MCDDANTLTNLEEQEYDLVILSGTLHQLEIEMALTTLARVTAKSGRVIMWEPMGTNPAFSFFRLLTPKLRTTDEHPLNFKDLKAIQKFSPAAISIPHVNRFSSSPSCNGAIKQTSEIISENKHKPRQT